MPDRELTSDEAPDPSRSYERSRPEDETGMGDLKAPKPRTSREGDRMHEAVSHRQGNRQINVEEETDVSGEPSKATTGRAAKKQSPRGSSPDPASDAPKSSRLRIDRQK